MSVFGRSHRSKLVAVATAVLAIVGVVLLGMGLTSKSSPPVPPASVLAQGHAGPTPSTGSPAPSSAPSSPVPSGGTQSPPAPPPSAAPAPSTTGPVLPASNPVRLSVPRLGVDQNLIPLGLKPDGTVAVPPLSQVRTPSWYDRSPTPGSVGPSAIYGHIDSAQYGQGVFYKLGAMRPGDPISITRADHTVAVFTVTAVREYHKQAFPTLQVYGNINHAGLRLITCGGPFDATTGNYLDNIVVYATLTSSHAA